jgi:hypothetical protein
VGSSRRSSFLALVAPCQSILHSRSDYCRAIRPKRPVAAIVGTEPHTGEVTAKRRLASDALLSQRVPGRKCKPMDYAQGHNPKFARPVIEWHKGRR